MKLPRDVSARDTLKTLRRLCFTVPNHRATLLKPLQSLLRQADVSLEEFLDAL